MLDLKFWRRWPGLCQGRLPRWSYLKQRTVSGRCWRLAMQRLDTGEPARFCRGHAAELIAKVEFQELTPEERFPPGVCALEVCDVPGRATTGLDQVKFRGKRYHAACFDIARIQPGFYD